MISVLPDSLFLVNVKLQECNVCVSARGGLWVWMDMRGWPEVDICTFGQGLTLPYHNIVWQGDQCLIFHIVLPY